MTESLLSEIKLALKRKELASKQYKLQRSDSDDVSQEYLSFLDVVNGTKVSGKIVTSPNERDHWPLLNHENVAPLFDVLNIRSDLKIYMTIDIQVKLKDIIHKEDFVYNSRCFDRKKSYAKGIFSGLSYIHSKSLCLMNLSDDNIYICNIHDKAVITNFSFISCSRKSTREKLNVPELYKAPETEKHEFDAIAAEMWASGTLMLDLFLAHMVPWAVIDHKPRRVMEMVNKLSLELLQAANAGSVVTVTHLTKFKTFQKCFFKESQSRITAKYASIASFLSTKLESKQLPKRTFNSNCYCFPQQTDRNPPFSTKNPLQSVNPKIGTNINNIFQNNNSDDSISEECFEYSESSMDIYLNSETQNRLKSSQAGSGDLSCTEQEESFRETSSNVPVQYFTKENKKSIKTEINVNKNSIENACDKQFGSNRKPYYDSEYKDGSFSSSKNFLNKTSKSCQMIKEGTNEFDSKYYQSKSLSSMNHDNEISYETAVKIDCSKAYLCSSHRPLPNESDLKSSDFCLNLLFENQESSEKSVTEKKFSQQVLNTSKSRGLHSYDEFITHKPKNLGISPNFFFKDSMQEIRLPTRNSSPHLNNKMSIKSIRGRFAAIRKAEVSLKDHKLSFISEELACKHQNFINEYKELLRQEKIRLCEVLSNEYKLSIGEVRKLLESFSSKPRYIKKYNRGSNELQYSSSESPDCKLAVKNKNDKIPRLAMNHNRQKLRNLEDQLKPHKRLSYCKAIESTPNQLSANWNYGLIVGKYPERNTLILTEKKANLLEDKNGQNTTNRKLKGARESQVTKKPKSYRLNPSLEDTRSKVKWKDSKELIKARKKEKKGKKDITVPPHTKKAKITRKPLCFSLCPGGKVEESASFDDLCEACKLGYEVTKQ